MVQFVLAALFRSLQAKPWLLIVHVRTVFTRL